MVSYMGTLFSKNVKYHISGPWGRLAFDIECKNRWSRDLGNVLLASYGDNANLQICIYFCMFWELFFSQISINWVINGKKSNNFCWIIYFVNSCENFYQTNCLRVSYRLPKSMTPFKMTRQICRITVFGGHCLFECSFFQSCSISIKTT